MNWISVLCSKNPSILSSKLTSLYFPVTHDSLCGDDFTISNILNSTISTRVLNWGVVKTFYQTQYVNIENQLKQGVRGFDIRCYIHPDGLVTGRHGNAILTTTIESQLRIINEFIKTNDGEFVIINLSHLCNDYTPLCLINFVSLILEIFEDRLYNGNDGNDGSVRDVIGKVVIICEPILKIYCNKFIDMYTMAWTYDNNKQAQSVEDIHDYLEYWNTTDVNGISFMQCFKQETTSMGYFVLKQLLTLRFNDIGILAYNTDVIESVLNFNIPLNEGRRALEFNGWKEDYLSRIIDFNNETHSYELV